MENLKDKITKLVMISILAGGLSGCYQKYNLDGEIVKYNKYLISPIKIITKDSVFIYSVLNKNRDSVESISVWPCSNGQCKIGEMQTHTVYEKGKEKMINKHQKRFNNYLNKINKIK